MVSLKVVVFACLLAAAVAVPQPQPTLSLLANGHRQGGGFLGLGNLGRAVTGVVGSANSFINNLLQLKIGNSFDDAIFAVISIVRGVGGVIDGQIPGLGFYFASLVIAVLKSIICALGSPGLLGQLFGFRGNNAAICRKDYGTKFGWTAYGKEKYDVVSIFNHFKCRNAKKTINNYIDTYSKGSGLNGVNVNIKVILQNLINIGIFAENMQQNSYDLNQNNVVDFLVAVLTITGGIGNNYQSGYGLELSDQLTVYVQTCFGNVGRDVYSRKQEINQNVARCKPFKWTVKFTADNNDNNNSSSENKNSSGNNNGSDDTNNSDNNNSFDNKKKSDDSSNTNKKEINNNNSNSKKSDQKNDTGKNKPSDNNSDKKANINNGPGDKDEFDSKKNPKNSEKPKNSKNSNSKDSNNGSDDSSGKIDNSDKTNSNSKSNSKGNISPDKSNTDGNKSYGNTKNSDNTDSNTDSNSDNTDSNSENNSDNTDTIDSKSSNSNNTERNRNSNGNKSTDNSSDDKKNSGRQNSGKDSTSKDKSGNTSTGQTSSDNKEQNGGSSYEIDDGSSNGGSVILYLNGRKCRCEEPDKQ